MRSAIEVHLKAHGVPALHEVAEIAGGAGSRACQ